jgi:hypothetical protein
MQRLLLPALLAFSLIQIGCGSKDEALDNDGGTSSNTDADPNAPDADPNAPDADPNAPDGAPSECIASGTECNNCIDDDADGAIDGADPECISIEDDDESSFATGIPGDNKDAVKQDCFFDGDSGAGNDGCDIHVCCLIDGDCPAELGGNNFDPVADCEPAQTQECIDKCGAITPVGCDCFGCCTICFGGVCNDILTNPGIYAEESCEGIANPVEGQCCEAEQQAGCYSCTQSDECGAPECDANPDDCILCPGETEDDLPAGCTAQECPDGQATCTQTADCGADKYCTGGCCIDAIIVD